MQTHVQRFFHFDETVPAAGFAFSVDQNAAGPIHHPKKWSFGYFDLCDGLVASRDARRGHGYVDEAVMVTDDDVGGTMDEFLPSFYPQRASGQRQENAHPDPGIAGEPVGLRRVFTEIAEKKERDHKDQHGQDEDQDNPHGPDPAGDIPNFKLLVHGGVRHGRWRLAFMAGYD